VAQFKSLTTQELVGNDELSDYLTAPRVRLSAAKNGGTFVGSREIAPDSLSAFGVVLPRGGLILPQPVEEVRVVLEGIQHRLQHARQIAFAWASLEAEKLGCLVAGRCAIFETSGLEYRMPLGLEWPDYKTSFRLKLFQKDAEDAITKIVFLKMTAPKIMDAATRESVRASISWLDTPAVWVGEGGRHRCASLEKGMAAISAEVERRDTRRALLRVLFEQGNRIKTTRTSFEVGYGTHDESHVAEKISRRLGDEIVSEDETRWLVAVCGHPAVEIMP